MNSHRKRPTYSAHRARPQTALERIDEFLRHQREQISAERIDLIRRRLFGPLPEVEPESGATNAERIRAMRQAYFADVDALEETGTVKVPR